jgi:hypothetical protein
MVLLRGSATGCDRIRTNPDAGNNHSFTMTVNPAVVSTK